MLERDDIAEAARRIHGLLRRTPVQLVEPGDDWLPGGGCLKLELLQHTGTFKARGAFNRILSAQERGELDPDIGIVVASGGNAGLANAYAARAVGVPATVFVPTTSSPTKVRRLREYGATVVPAGTEYADAYDAAMDHVAGAGAVYCHAYDQPEVCAGAGTMGLELLDQLAIHGREVDTVLLAVGGGGLMAGVATALPDSARVVGVEPTGAPTLQAALEAGGPVDVAVSGVAADSLGARRLGSIAWDVARRRGVRGVLVDDAALVHARRQVWERYRLPLEAGAAAPVAALLCGAYLPSDDERVAVILCGANTDPSDWPEIQPKPGRRQPHLTGHLSDRSKRRTVEIEQSLKPEVGPVGVGHRSTSSTWRVVALVLGASTCGVLGLLGLGEVLLLRMSLPTTPAARAWRVFGLTTGLFAASVLVLQSHASWVGLTWALLFGGLLVGPGLLVGCRRCDALDGRLLPRSEP